MKKVMLVYPPGKIYQRGEDRSQGNIGDSSATTVRAANDLGYAASMLKKKGYNVFLKDFQNEKLALADIISEFNEYSPDVIFMSITNATIFEDLKIVNELKKLKENLVVIIKGALFFDPENDMLSQLDLKNVDYLIGGESDFIAADLVESHFNGKNNISDIRGILYKKEGRWVKTDFKTWEEGLEKLSYPDRGLMANRLYIRPDTGEPQATITTSRGCPAECTFCLTPRISGRKLRLRKAEDIFKEIESCYYDYEIKNFFFKSDTFTIDKNWVKELCDYIRNSELKGKIQWVANSRTKPLEKETLQYMKDAGCWMIAFGFESGSQETLLNIKKGATVEDNLKAAAMAKEVGLKIFGFYLIGLPWENMSHLLATKKMIYDIDADFIEIHIAIPYPGTPLYDLAKTEGLINDTALGKDYFHPPTVGTKYLHLKTIQDFRKKLLVHYHLRLGYICKKLKYAAKNPKILENYAKFGLRLIRNNL